VADMAAFHRGSRVGDWAPLCELTSRLLAAALPPDAAPEAAAAAEQPGRAAAAAAAGRMGAAPAQPDSEQQASELAAGHQQAAMPTPAGQSGGQPAARVADDAEVHGGSEAPTAGATAGAVAAADVAEAPAPGDLAAQALQLLQAVLIGHCQVTLPWAPLMNKVTFGRKRARRKPPVAACQTSYRPQVIKVSNPN
jgi:hypothetical protein